jgi:hypothetical protein
MYSKYKLQILIFIILAGFLGGQSAFGQNSAYPEIQEMQKLELVKCYPVSGVSNIQPSGLTLWQGELYSVSDKHDAEIYKIELVNDTAYFRTFFSFQAASPLYDDRLDFEGITCDPQGNFFLVSETQYQILKLDPRTSQVEWIGPNLKEAGVNAGLFQKKNANLEGICYLGENSFVLCAERQPRGMLELLLMPYPEKIEVFRLDQSRFQLQADRLPDFSDLYYFNNELYALQRNAELISTIDMKNGYTEGRAFSFAHLFEQDEFKYTDMRFGLAEGLAVDDRYFYIILDNNDDARLLNPDDRRPLLFILKTGKN